MIPLSGSFEVLLDDGMNKKKIMLNKPNKGLLIPQGIWREMDNFFIRCNMHGFSI